MRQFLAIELSSAMRDDLRSLQDELQENTRGWRWVKPESIHLTLRFLGEVPGDFDDRCRASWRETAAAAAPFRLRLDGVGAFPPRGKPRVLWVGVSEDPSQGRLAGLAGAFERAARDAGFEAENRPFRAHLTLARCRRQGQATLPELREYSSRAVLEVNRVVLFRSELLPTGARYSVLEDLPLETP